MSEQCEGLLLSSPSQVQGSFRNSQDMLEINSEPKESSTSDDEAGPVISKKFRTKNFSDSESDLDKESKHTQLSLKKSEVIVQIDTSSQNRIKKSRIKNMNDSESSSSEDKVIQKSIRGEHKLKRLRDKFKGFISQQIKGTQEIETASVSKLPDSNIQSNENSEEEVSCLKIKQEIKKSAYTMKAICDPDTSDEEKESTSVFKQKSKQPRSTKPTSPKPIKMSAKQAMDNMHKIKSESNRMLREKQVSLPYHRPKALSLKDIMSRGKPAVTSDGKALPIKMNNDQLKQYVLLLEQRQKEVIELCKSDSEEEEKSDHETNFNNDILVDSTLNVDTEVGLETTNTKGQPAEGGKANPIETSCIGADIQDKMFTMKSDFDKQTESSMEIETVNKSVNINVNIIPNVTDDNNILSNYKEENRNILLGECTEKQSSELQQYTEEDSQNMVLRFDSEINNLLQESERNKSNERSSKIHTFTVVKKTNESMESEDDDEFLTKEFNYHEIDKLIESANVDYDGVKSLLHKDAEKKTNPKLMGAPGMLIDLDNTDPLASNQLTGIDLLKERFTYFAKLKSLEDTKQDRDQKFKPGLQHLKLKQELEEQIAEQRTMEWEKRLEEENRLKSDCQFSDDDIEKLEAKLVDIDEKLVDEKIDSESSEGEEEPIENDIILKDKPTKRNPMVDDEAEESDCDEELAGADNYIEMSNVEADASDEADAEDNDDDESSDSSSESEEEVETKLKKRRILKAFEDSDDESANLENNLIDVNRGITNNIDVESNKKDNEIIKDSQDDELQLAQAHKSSDELFTTQESEKPNVIVAALNKNNEDNISGDLGTQTFSILDSIRGNNIVDLDSPAKTSVCTTQTIEDTQEMSEDVVALCTGKFYDNPFVSQDDKSVRSYSPLKVDGSQLQEFGEDVAALCTGNFYDNPFVSQFSEHNESEALGVTQNSKIDEMVENERISKSSKEEETPLNSANNEKSILSSILEELDEPNFKNTENINKSNVQDSQIRKKFVIDSDDETTDGTGMVKKKNKKRRKRKAAERALQISDDEKEEELDKEHSDVGSEISEDEERIVEYDSEENEVVVQQKPAKKKHVGAFFENEAELTSEDEWVGSGDEDERGLDRMEREEGDDEIFHQGKLQRELGQIHMREVLDQDKREVRMIQELLFEDGDLGEGHRQRKFRWKNADGEEEVGTHPNEFIDTQEEEFESEEQWRKQRHEREIFLRKLQEKDSTDFDTSTTNRSAMIKANLSSRSTTKTCATEDNKIVKVDTTVPEKKNTTDIPSSYRAFTIFPQNYHGSLLTRGRGALARLAALATPLATDDDDTPKVVTSANRRNFVFTALSQVEQPKVTKRKADENANTPRLIKKMKTEDTNKHYKSSLFDYLQS